jgi:RNA polymerase sigma-70 factor (sigma-E family)
VREQVLGVTAPDELSGPVRSTPPTGPDPDEAGFRLWAASRRTTLRRTAFLLCADWHQADDLVQEALVKVYARWHRIASRGDVDGYVRRVLVTTFLDARRRPGRREVSYATVPDAVDPTADRALESAEGSTYVAALRAVPDGQRAVLVLRFVEDLSVEQTADALGCSTGNVKSQTARGLARLREVLCVDVDGQEAGT